MTTYAFAIPADPATPIQWFDPDDPAYPAYLATLQRYQVETHTRRQPDVWAIDGQDSLSPIAPHTPTWRRVVQHLYDGINLQDDFSEGGL